MYEHGRLVVCKIRRKRKSIAAMDVTELNRLQTASSVQLCVHNLSAFLCRPSGSPHALRTQPPNRVVRLFLQTVQSPFDSAHGQLK